MKRCISPMAAAVMTVVFLCAVPAHAQEPAETPPPATETAEEPVVHDIEPWRPQLAQIKDQLKLIAQFAALTALSETTIKVPKELQKLAIPELEAKNVEVFLEEVRFHKIRLDQEETPHWLEDKPAIPALLDFATLGAAATVKTPVGRFRVFGTFRDGSLPCDFQATESGYNVNVIPERRADDAKLGKVSLSLGKRRDNSVLSALLGKEFPMKLLQLAAGQTLAMDQSTLLGDKAVDMLLETLIK